MTEPTQGEPTGSSEPQRLSIGVIVGPHGVRGQLKMQIWTHFPERIPRLKTIYFDESDEPRRLRRATVNATIALLDIEGSESRDEAARYRGAVVRIPAGEAAPLEEGEFFHHQIIGLPVFNEEGQPLGEVTDILETGANDVYVVRDAEGRENLFPALESVVLSIDPEARRMVVRPLRYADE